MKIIPTMHNLHMWISGFVSLTMMSCKIYIDRNIIVYWEECEVNLNTLVEASVCSEVELTAPFTWLTRATDSNFIRTWMRSWISIEYHALLCSHIAINHHNYVKFWYLRWLMKRHINLFVFCTTFIHSSEAKICLIWKVNSPIQSAQTKK